MIPPRLLGFVNSLRMISSQTAGSMNGASVISKCPTLLDTPNIISSPASEVGPTLSLSPIGRLIARWRRLRVLASPSARPVGARASRMKDTSGRNFSDWLAKPGFQQSLASRLVDRMACYGSMEYALTWKLSVTKSGRILCVLRASGLRTHDTDCIGWPTPIVNDQTGSTHGYGVKPGDGSERARFLKLPGVAKMYGWPTLCAQDGAKLL